MNTSMPALAAIDAVKVSDNVIKGWRTVLEPDVVTAFSMTGQDILRSLLQHGKT